MFLLQNMHLDDKNKSKENPEQNENQNQSKKSKQKQKHKQQQQTKQQHANLKPKNLPKLTTKTTTAPTTPATKTAAVIESPNTSHLATRGDTNIRSANDTPPTEKRRTVVGAWKNVSEFQKVYNSVYSANANMETKKRALSQIRIWNLRRGNLCPAAVLATGVILEVQLQDDQNGQNLQTLYASAFTRFFNFMSSIMQTHNMRTMYDTAKQLGLNSFVVDLRHLCAHGQVLPPLQVLRKTAEYCISWLHDYYWHPQLIAMSDVDALKIRRKEKTEFDNAITKLFTIYDTSLECYMKGAETMKQSKRIVHGNRFVEMRAYWEHRNITNFLAMFESVVKDLITLVKRETTIKDLCEVFIDALLRMRFFYTTADYFCYDDNFEKLIACMQTFFRMVASIGYMEELFFALLRITENTNEDSVRRKGASFWAVRIAEGFLAIRKCKEMYKDELTRNPKLKQVSFTSLHNNKQNAEKLRELLIYTGINMQQTLLFGDALRHPCAWVFDIAYIETHLESLNEYSAPVLKKLLPLVEPTLSAEEMDAVGWLIDTLFKTSVMIKDSSQLPSAMPSDANVYTAEDFLHAVDANNSNPEPGATLVKKYGVWLEVPNDATHNWANCPLGRMPWN